MPDLFFLIFLFVLGACIGSFLNVAVGRFPEDERASWLAALMSPPSHCPKCQHLLAWYDNVPILGWIFLRGRCRYCAKPISVRYPIVEFLTGAIFAFYYGMYFVAHIGPCAPQPLIDVLPGGQVVDVNRMPTHLYADWPLFSLHLFMLAALLVMSLIDLDRFVIPMHLPWLMAGVGVVVHTLVDTPATPGALNLLEAGRPTASAALAAGGGIGLLLSIGLLELGIFKQSFPEGEPTQIDHDEYERELKQAKKDGREPPPEPVSATPAQIRAEIRREMLFLIPPMLLALVAVLLTERVPAIRSAWQSIAANRWVSGLLGSVLGALVGGLVVWTARIFGSLGFGKVAMGLGDVHLMFGVGAIIGAGAATVAFFLAPFAGLLMGLWLLITRRQRELPLGPHLSLATAAVLLCYCPIADYLRPGLQGLAAMLRGWLGGV